MNQKGFINFIVIGIVLAVVLGVGGYFALVRKPLTPSETQQPIIPPSDTTVTPTLPPDTSIKTTPPSGTKTTIKLPTSPSKLDAGAPDLPADQALAEITVLSQVGEEWKVRVDKIQDYIRYPAATNPQLKVDDTIYVDFDRWLDTVKTVTCPEGYTEVYGTTEAQFPAPPPPPQPRIIVDEKYLAKLFGCFANETFTCPKGINGWSASFYNPTPVVIEPKCMKKDITPIPPPEPQR